MIENIQLKKSNLHMKCNVVKSNLQIIMFFAHAGTNHQEIIIFKMKMSMRFRRVVWQYKFPYPHMLVVSEFNKHWHENTFFPPVFQMYDNIAALRFQKNPNIPKEMIVTAMISAEKEVMDFKGSIPAADRVEVWMTDVLQEMRRTNRLITKEAIFYYCYQKTR